jgi:hypothetical protein
VNPPGYHGGMDDTVSRTRPQHGASDSETQHQMNNRLGRLARDRESLREMRAILGRIYGKSAVTTFKTQHS